MKFFRNDVYESNFNQQTNELIKIDVTIKTKKELLDDITEYLKKDRENLGLISCELLQTMWKFDFLPGERKPFQAMSFQTFLQFLLKGKYRNARQKFLGTRLREEIEAQAFSSKRNGFERFIGATDRNLVPISHVKAIPGTMF